jgi:putative flippase GtrA
VKASPRWWREAIGFGLVGCVGFAVDAAIFLALTHAATLPVLVARLLAFVPATVVTWSLQRRLVFRRSASTERKHREYVRHVAAQSLGIAVNFACFWIAVRAGLGEGNAQVVPLAIGTLAGMCFNFLSARRFVYRG